MANVDSVPQENRLFQPDPALVKKANISGMGAYQTLSDEAEREFAGFWAGSALANPAALEQLKQVL